MEKYEMGYDYIPCRGKGGNVMVISKKRTRKLYAALLAAVIAVAAMFSAFNVNAASNSATVNVYRMYNPRTGEHLYTTSVNERTQMITDSWRWEGTAWKASASPRGGSAVYRLYNPNSGEHHYTKNMTERNYLTKIGWKMECVAFYDGSRQPYHMDVYRLYNPNAKGPAAHHYTTSRTEKNSLVRSGWRYEGVAWYAAM